MQTPDAECLSNLAAVAVCAAVSLLLSACGPHPALVRYVEKRNPEVVFSIPAQDSLVALTIDDGPHPALTPAILDLLAEHDAKATFFLMGKNVAGNEALVRRMVAEGHEIGNHMMGAFPAILLPLDTFEASLLETQAVLSGYGPVRWFRPASGFFDRPMLDIVARHGYRMTLGSVYPNDAQNPFPSYLAGYILRHVRPGSVIILHDGSRLRWRTVHALRRVLPELRRRGYRVVTLSELEGVRSALR